MNEKNFVGLAVNNEYIACGSETNELFVYHKVKKFTCEQIKTPHTLQFLIRCISTRISAIDVK